MARGPTPKSDRLREMREEQHANEQIQKRVNKEELQKTVDEVGQRVPKLKRKWRIHSS